MCKYANPQTQRLSQLGGPPQEIRTVFCKLKQQSSEAQLEVYSALFERGLCGSFINDVCPLADGSRFRLCPFFTP